MDLLSTNDLPRQVKTHVRIVGVLRVYYIGYLIFSFFSYAKDAYQNGLEVNYDSFATQTGSISGMLIATTIILLSLIYSFRMASLEITLNHKIFQ